MEFYVLKREVTERFSILNLTPSFNDCLPFFLFSVTTIYIEIYLLDYYLKKKYLWFFLMDFHS